MVFFFFLKKKNGRGQDPTGEKLGLIKVMVSRMALWIRFDGVGLLNEIRVLDFYPIVVLSKLKKNFKI